MEEKSICKNCGAELLFRDNFCPKCGEDIADFEESTRTADENYQEVDILSSPTTNVVISKRYPALRIFANLYYGLAFIFAIFIVFLIMFLINNLPGAQGFQGIMLTLMFGIIGFVSLIAYAEGILVFLDVEENTRATTRLLKKILDEIKHDKN